MNTQEAIEILERDAPNYADFLIVRDYDDAVLKYRQALTHAIEHMKRGALDVVPDGWRMTEKQQIVWDWAASHGVTLLADDCNDLLWKLIIVEEK
jgi:hypothetical protein